MTEPQSEREQLEVILCTAIHRQTTGEWDGGERGCEKCMAAAREALPELLKVLGIDVDTLDQPGLDDQIIQENGMPAAEHAIQPWMKKYLPLFVVPPGATAETLYTMPREMSRQLGPEVGLACVSVMHQVMLLARLHRYGYLRPPVDLLRGA